MSLCAAAIIFEFDFFINFLYNIYRKKKERKIKAVMSRYFLVNYEEDYADEFYVYGMKVFTKAEYISFKNNQRYARHLERIGEIETGDWKWIELTFGSNEWLSFSSVDEIIDALEVKEITEQEYNTLKNLGLSSFGDDSIFNFFENIRLGR